MLTASVFRLLGELGIFGVFYFISNWIVNKTAVKNINVYLLVSLIGAVYTYVAFLQSSNSTPRYIANELLQLRSIIVITFMYIWSIKSVRQSTFYYVIAATLFSIFTYYNTEFSEILFSSSQPGFFGWISVMLIAYSIYLYVTTHISTTSDAIQESTLTIKSLPVIYIVSVWACSQSEFINNYFWAVFLLFIAPIIVVLYNHGKYSTKSLASPSQRTDTGKLNTIDSSEDSAGIDATIEKSKKKRKPNPKRKKLEEVLHDTIFDDTDPFRKLDEMIGMAEVKKQLQKILALYELEQLQKSNGTKIENYGNHMVFYGNPGTGKTTVARIVAEILHSKNMIQNANVVEVTRKDVIGQYIGESLKIFQEKVNSAKGGILFIDEAYTLHIPESPNDYGHEVIGELLGVLENNREDLIVIIAGYENEIESFLKSNPGLESRFNMRIHFPNYSIEDLLKIFDTFLNTNGLSITDSARNKVRMKLQVESSSSTFANARTVRNIFAACKMNLALRLSQAGTISNYQGVPISDVDIPND